jgi:putative transposase
MPTACTHLYVHCVWATWDRQPLLDARMERAIYGCIAAKCVELRCEALRIGGVENHVHVVVRLHASVAVADLVKGMKGASSHLVNHEVIPGEGFRWQGSYGAFTVSPDDVGRVCNYVESQKEHHANRTLLDEWERCEIADS